MRRRKLLTPMKRTNRLKDKIYREMYLLESGRPGAEMGLALALLRAWSEIESLREEEEVKLWLHQISPLCVKMIEDSLGRVCGCGPVIQ